MNWYYADQGQQVGPVEETELAQLEQAGKINDNTLVWRAGLDDWRPYGEVKPQVGHAQNSPPPAPSGPAPTSTEVVCTECGQIFPIEETIRHGEARLCAKCKPIFLQKLAEGAHIKTGRMEYASVMTRFAALFLDRIILSVINYGVFGLMGFAGLLGGQRTPGAEKVFIGVSMVVLLALFALNVGYEVFFIGKYGATLGKMACKIKVVDANGNPIGYGRACARFFAKILSSLICLIGFIIAFFDEERRALHDRICNTRVVKKN